MSFRRRPSDRGLGGRVARGSGPSSLCSSLFVEGGLYPEAGQGVALLCVFHCLLRFGVRPTPTSRGLTPEGTRRRRQLSLERSGGEGGPVWWEPRVIGWRVCTEYTTLTSFPRIREAFTTQERSPVTQETRHGVRRAPKHNTTVRRLEAPTLHSLEFSLLPRSSPILTPWGSSSSGMTAPVPQVWWNTRRGFRRSEQDLLKDIVF